MERIFQKDALEQYGPMGQFQNITVRIKGANFHGGESAASTMWGTLLQLAWEDVFQNTWMPKLGYKCLSSKKS